MTSSETPDDLHGTCILVCDEEVMTRLQFILLADLALWLLIAQAFRMLIR